MALPVPGTVHLIDLHGNLHVKHGKGNQDVVLIPQPSSDPEDPLNWSWRRKQFNRFWQCLWMLVGCSVINSLTPAYLLIQEETEITVANLNTGIGLMYLFLGWGNIILQPWGMNYGRRPVLLVSLLGTSMMIFWSAYITTPGVWYVNRIIMGIFFAPVETLVEIIVTDLSFTHERGFHLGVYQWTLFNGAFIAPIITGYIADSMGWRWIQYICTIIGLSTTFLMFFFFEETMYYRHTVQDELLDEVTDSPSNQSPQTEPIEKVPSDSKSHPITTSIPESELSATIEHVSMPLKTRLFRTMRLWGFRAPDQPNTFWKFFFLPFTLLRYPAMIFAGFLVGSVLAWNNVLNATTAEILGQAPYNFTTNQIGLSYLAALIGTTVGCFLSGWLSDIVSERIARRRNGIKEPEDRLWLACIAFLLHPAGCLLYGYGAVNHIHWIGLLFGMALFCLCIPMGSSIGLTYVIDSYKEVAGEAVVSVILVRNMIGFAFAYAVAPMISSLGLSNAWLVIAILGAACWALCFLFIWKGKDWRRATAAGYWNLVEERGLKAH